MHVSGKQALASCKRVTVRSGNAAAAAVAKGRLTALYCGARLLLTGFFFTSLASDARQAFHQQWAFERYSSLLSVRLPEKPLAPRGREVGERGKSAGRLTTPPLRRILLRLGTTGRLKTKQTLTVRWAPRKGHGQKSRVPIFPETRQATDRQRTLIG